MKCRNTNVCCDILKSRNNYTVKYVQHATILYCVPVCWKAVLNSCNDLVNIQHVMRNYVSLKPQMVIVG